MNARLKTVVIACLMLLMSAGVSLCLVSPARAGTAEKEALNIIEAELVKTQAKRASLLLQPKSDENTATLSRLDADVASLEREVAGWLRKVHGKSAITASPRKAFARLDKPVNRSSEPLAAINTNKLSAVDSQNSEQASTINLAMTRDLSIKTAGIWESKP